MENKMADVAKLLGVELSEEFTLKNSNFRYKFTTKGLRKRYNTSAEWSSSCMLDDLLLGRVEIVKKPKTILDEKEKEYLSAVIKPFRNRIIYIMKTYEDDQSEFLEIRAKYYDAKYYDANKNGDELILLPSFKKGTMYKGMKVNREYTLEQLGL